MTFDQRTLARLTTAIENRDPAALATLATLPPGHARIVGITGPPGAGKSTLVDALAAELRRKDKTVAILAVDPTSRRTGGAILGDRIRMQQHHSDPGVFIRSLATRGESGGLARATADVVRLMDAAGMDYVLIETVGVGQDEIAVAALAQVTVVVLVPGMGDDIQAIKAGIMEIADIFVINKSDHPGADRLALELHAEAFTCPVIRTVATEGKGIAELLAAITPKAPLPNGRGSVSRSSLTEPRPSGSGASPTLDHLGIAVPNLDAALPFYQSLGLTPHREEVPAEKVRLAMLPVSNARLELLEPTSPDSPISNFLTKRGPGLHHIALRVPDLAATVAALKASGVRLLNDPRPGAGGHIYVFVHPASTGGVLLELIQEHST